MSNGVSSNPVAGIKIPKFSERELIIIVLAFILGAISSILIALPVSSTLNEPDYLVGFVEEPAKIVLVYAVALLFPAAFLSKDKCAVYGAAAGLGFAFFEDIIYFFIMPLQSSIMQGTAPVASVEEMWLRITVSLPGHILWSSLAAMGIVFFVVDRNLWWKTLGFLVLAALLHGVYDATVGAGIEIGVLLIVASAGIWYAAYRYVPETGIAEKYVGILIAPPNNEIFVPDNKVFGRDDFTEYVPYDEATLISRNQFTISRIGEQFFIEDLGSKAGTSVNGTRLKPYTKVTLRPGSKITLPSRTTLTFTTKGAVQAVSPVTTLEVPSTGAGILIVPPDHEIAVSDNKNFGRDDFAEYLPFGEANLISRNQFTISRIGDQYTIEDLGSKGGTRVDGTPIKPYTKVSLKAGSKITLPNGTTLTFTTKGAIQAVSPVTTTRPAPAAPQRPTEPESTAQPTRTSTDARATQRADAVPRQAPASTMPESATKPMLARIVAPNNSEISLVGSRKFGRDDFRNMVAEEKLPFISRQQFTISVSGEAYYVEDLQSNNGTTLNGEPLQPGSQRELKQGDEICCANVLPLKFQQ